jgi:hypothetical protein
VGPWLQLLEGAITAVPEELWPLRVGHVAQVLFMHDVAIDHEEVRPAIEVSIEEKQPKGDHAQRRRSDASAVRLLDEHVGAHPPRDCVGGGRQFNGALPLDPCLAVERRRLAGKIANRDAELVVVVDIGSIDTHAGIGDPAFIEHQPCLRPEFAKRAITLIDKEQTGREIVSHQDIGPAVIVVIDDCDAEHAGLWRHDTSRRADILEASVAEVAI